MKRVVHRVMQEKGHLERVKSMEFGLSMKGSGEKTAHQTNLQSIASLFFSGYMNLGRESRAPIF